jgi:nicotinamidase-related amidase
MKAQDSAILLIDMQEKLMPLVVDAVSVEKNTRWLLEIAQYLSIPVLTTEQYPKGLGHTVQGLIEFSPPTLRKEKIAFSAMNDTGVSHEVHTLGREQWILVGIETHVCVLQTALGLREHGKKVFVVEDCTSSRETHDKRLALDRMRHQGVQIVSREMVVFEWLNQGGTPQFKHIIEEFIK